MVDLVFLGARLLQPNQEPSTADHDSFEPDHATPATSDRIATMAATPHLRIIARNDDPVPFKHALEFPALRIITQNRVTSEPPSFSLADRLARGWSLSFVDEEPCPSFDSLSSTSPPVSIGAARRSAEVIPLFAGLNLAGDSPDSR